MIIWVWWCTLWSWSYNVGGHDQADLKIHLGTIIVQSLRLRLTKYDDALGSHDSENLDKHLEGVNQMVVNWVLVNLDTVNLQKIDLEEAAVEEVDLEEVDLEKVGLEELD